MEAKLDEQDKDKLLALANIENDIKDFEDSMKPIAYLIQEELRKHSDLHTAEFEDQSELPSTSVNEADDTLLKLIALKKENLALRIRFLKMTLDRIDMISKSHEEETEHFEGHFIEN